MTATSRRQRQRQSLRVESLEDRRTPAALFFDDFSSADSLASWTRGPNWQIGPAAASTGHEHGYPDPSSDYSTSGDNRLAGVVIGGNVPTALAPASYMVSPPMDLANETSLTFNFARWLNSDYPNYMTSTIDVFDGSTWKTVFAVTPTSQNYDSSWQLMSYDLTPYRNAQLRVRFGYSVGQSGVYIVSGWNIDDVRLGRKPIAHDDAFSTLGNKPLPITPNVILGNDVHPDGAALTIASMATTSSHGGTVSLAKGNYLYTPPVNFQGQDSVTYTVTDPYGWTSSATIQIQVVDHPPKATDIHLQTMPGQALSIAKAVFNSHASDVDDDPLVTVVDTTTA
jgi:Bacterial Ig domain